MFLMMMFVVNGFIFDGAVMAVRGLISGTAYSGTPLTQEGYIFYPIMILLWSVANFLVFKHGLRWMRLEIFTQQRIVIRLNRITRRFTSTDRHTLAASRRFRGTLPFQR